ncbi:hypothetical protein P692DRAFT_201807506 [Suillus brevipes Sb2]|nr:hypothetical protein P692DRAFT_201807506 [Suillus brevipes Sb2]
MPPSHKPLSDANATRRPPIRPTPRQVPQGFFDGVETRDPPSLQHCRRSSVPSWGSSPRALLARLRQPFHHSQPNVDESTELQQRPGPSTSPHRMPSVVEVPALDDKKALYTARRPETASEMAKRIKNPKWWSCPNSFIDFAQLTPLKNAWHSATRAFIRHLVTQKVQLLGSIAYHVGSAVLDGQLLLQHHQYVIHH